MDLLQLYADETEDDDRGPDTPPHVAISDHATDGEQDQEDGPKEVGCARTPLFLPELGKRGAEAGKEEGEWCHKRQRMQKGRGDARFFLDVEAAESAGSGGEDEEEEEGLDAAFINNSAVGTAHRVPPVGRLDGPEERTREAEELAAQARRFDDIARKERGPVVNVAPRLQQLGRKSEGLMAAEALCAERALRQAMEKHVSELRGEKHQPGPPPAEPSFRQFARRGVPKPPPENFVCHRWGRLRTGPHAGQFVLTESAATVIVLGTGEDAAAFHLLRMKGKTSLDKALSWESVPPHEIDRWDSAPGNWLWRAANPWPGMVCAPGCRVVVTQGGEKGENGFVIGVRNRRWAVVRIAYGGRRILLSAPTVYAWLHALAQREEDDILVDVEDMRRHLLSFPMQLNVLDRVRVVCRTSTAVSIKGQVSGIDDSVADPIVSIVGRIVGRDSRVIEVPMSGVARKSGIVVNTTYGAEASAEEVPLGLEIFVEVGKDDLEEWAWLCGKRKEMAQLLLGGVEGGGDGDVELLAPEDRTGAGYELVLCEQAEFTELDARPGGWTLASTPEATYRAQAASKRDVKRDEEEMHSGRRYRGKEVLVGRVGRVVDDHDVLVQGKTERQVVLTVKIEGHGQPFQVPEEQVGAASEESTACDSLGRDNEVGLGRGGGRGALGADATADAGARAGVAGDSRREGGAAPAPPPVLGRDGGRWLCIPRLKGKRVDVRVLPITMGRVSGRQASAEGKYAFIEVDEEITAATLNNTIPVRIGEHGTIVKIAPRWLEPLRTTGWPPQVLPDVSIAIWPCRVVVIGRDHVGGTEHLGEYGWTRRGDAPDMVSNAKVPIWQGANEVQRPAPARTDRVIARGGGCIQCGRIRKHGRRELEMIFLPFPRFFKWLLRELTFIRAEEAKGHGGWGTEGWCDGPARTTTPENGDGEAPKEVGGWGEGAVGAGDGKGAGPKDVGQWGDAAPRVTTAGDGEDGKEVEAGAERTAGIEAEGYAANWVPELTEEVVAQILSWPWPYPRAAMRRGGCGTPRVSAGGGAQRGEHTNSRDMQMEFMLGTLEPRPGAMALHPSTELELDWDKGIRRRQMQAALSHPEIWTAFTIRGYDRSLSGADDALEILRNQMPLMRRVKTLCIWGSGQGHSEEGPGMPRGLLAPTEVSLHDVVEPEVDFDLPWKNLLRYSESNRRRPTGGVPARHLQQMVALTHLTLHGYRVRDGLVKLDALLELDVCFYDTSGTDALEAFRTPALRKLRIIGATYGIGDMGPHILQFLDEPHAPHLEEICITKTTDASIMALFERCPGLGLEIFAMSDRFVLSTELLKGLATNRPVGRLSVCRESRPMDNPEVWVEALKEFLKTTDMLHIHIKRFPQTVRSEEDPEERWKPWGAEYRGLLTEYADQIEQEECWLLDLEALE
ncbi:hypothetical protein C8R44DRAFT_752594 [Mycena epipterygia]|nr:hypothetical protein C8R44DRAFT_752594 [Mycena epipterygia]